MLISGTHLGITDQAQQSHNYRYPHEHERIFFVTMYNRNAFVVLSLNKKLIFFSTSDKFNCPITLPHKKEWRVKSKSSVKTYECGIFMRYDFYTIFYPNDYYLFSFKKRFRAVRTKRRKPAKIKTKIKKRNV